MGEKRGRGEFGSSYYATCWLGAQRAIGHLSCIKYTALMGHNTNIRKSDKKYIKLILKPILHGKQPV